MKILWRISMMLSVLMLSACIDKAETSLDPERYTAITETTTASISVDIEPEKEEVSQQLVIDPIRMELTTKEIVMDEPIVEQTKRQKEEPTTYEEIVASSATTLNEVECESTTEEETTAEEVKVANSDVELIALLLMCEAEGECDYGLRLVVDTVLNRVDDDRFPDNIHDVCYQKSQFTGLTGSRVEKCYVREDYCQIVREEMENRTDYDVIFFRTNHYHTWGTPMFKVGCHYFSSY